MPLSVAADSELGRLDVPSVAAAMAVLEDLVVAEQPRACDGPVGVEFDSDEVVEGSAVESAAVVPVEIPGGESSRFDLDSSVRRRHEVVARIVDRRERRVEIARDERFAVVAAVLAIGASADEPSSALVDRLLTAVAEQVEVRTVHAAVITAHGTGLTVGLGTPGERDGRYRRAMATPDAP